MNVATQGKARCCPDPDDHRQLHISSLSVVCLLVASVSIIVPCGLVANGSLSILAYSLLLCSSYTSVRWRSAGRGGIGLKFEYSSLSSPLRWSMKVSVCSSICSSYPSVQYRQEDSGLPNSNTRHCHHNNRIFHLPQRSTLQVYFLHDTQTSVLHSLV